jgi:subtilisin family serine protease
VQRAPHHQRLGLVALLVATFGMLVAPKPAAAGRVIVSYGPRVDACVHCLLKRGDSSGSGSLDRAHHELGVLGARALFLRHHTTGHGRAAAWAASADRTRMRFPERAPRGVGSSPDLSRVYVLDLDPGTDPVAAAARLAADPDVEYAEPDVDWHITLTPNDPFYASSQTWGQSYPDLWGLYVTNAATAWNTSTGTATVVAVVDTGVDLTLPDLAANLWVNPGEVAGNGIDDDGNGYVDDVHGWDFVDQDDDPKDEHSHGTHVAGTVAAVGNNGLGVVGMAWGARVMAVRGLGASGSGDTAGLADGIVYAAENGADVISNSWGGYGSSQVLRDAIAAARSLGSVVVAAAGNGATSVDGFEPATIPGVITVGASTSNDQIASFSNFGDALAVAAPGVDILSLRAPGLGPTSSIVAGSYLRYSGTSMATPHVSALAAVLLSAQPSLTVDEVLWHLELNADQPGVSGWEGQPWNPYFGWGRINAARIFDPVPVTTRLSPHALEVHTYAGDSNAGAAAADVSFTTIGSVPWTVTTPPWLPPVVTAGSGSARLDFGVDATGLAPARLEGLVTVSAPGAEDGGASIPVTAELHRDERIGDIVTIDPPEAHGSVRTVSDGVVTLVAWITPDGRIVASRIDGANAVSPPVELSPGPFPLPGPGAAPAPYDLDVASDGGGFLVTWVERSGVEWVRAIRVSPDGLPLDARPQFIEARPSIPNRFFRNSQVAFDGNAYTVLWNTYDGDRGRSEIWFRRVGTDGTARSKRRRLRRTDGFVTTRLGCVAGHCLAAWTEGFASINATGKQPIPALGLVLAGDRVLNKTPRQLLLDVDAVADVHGAGTQLALLGLRTILCPDGFVCGESVVGAVFDRDGGLVAGGTRLDVGPTAGNASAFPTSLTHDGTNWLATFLSGGRIFGARMGSDGARLDNELIGLLLNPDTTAAAPSIVATNHDTVLTWIAYPSGGSPVAPTTLVAERALAHATVPAIPTLTIGSIGSRQVAEKELLTFAVAAPALNPTTATFSVANLPSGAVFDAPTRTFRWVPAADRAGTYPSVHFAATDGAQTVGEDVTLTVSEAVHSIRGTVRNADLSPTPLILLRLTGAQGGARTVFTDMNGSYRFDDLRPRRYRIRLDPTSARQYTPTPGSASTMITSADVGAFDFVVTPR